ncbi:MULTISPECIES: hypothetical protein [Streptomyces]|uniref:Uncharacterized protein n=1 Tax=Streptomyces chengmaiensis TaxID=3040919 RepID=A0ABT6HVX7_9ACTN|nr:MULTISPECIES: hypothetical protein [Streptomyces]MDH2392477.1 hypothetical protein [Streptomyces chengmaiensis]WRQ81420.1 hypothetical protein I3F59_019870 [Streptomyces sp. MUM 178J]
MAVDPTDPDTFEDIAEDDAAVDLDEEVPEADAAEQHTDVRQERDDEMTDAARGEANEADRAEQARVVALNEDDYR